MNSILREIKLSKVTDTPLSDDASKLVEFWDELWIDMKIYINTDKGEIKCWKDGYNYYYFRQDDENDKFWCNHNKIWVFLQEEMNFNHNEIIELIQYMVIETLNHKVNHKVHTPPLFVVGCMMGTVVDKSLNCGVNIPHTSSTFVNF